MSLHVWFVGCLLLLAPAVAGTNNVIVVSASRLDDLDLMAVDTAADVTVLDRSAIEQSGAASVPELLQNEAGVLIRSATGNGNDGQISMRGFGENSHLRSLVLVDGHSVNRPDMGGIEWQSIPVGNIERIEIIRGGQNVLYGDRALSGVVKITTKRGHDAGLQLSGDLGSFGYLAGSAFYGESVGDIDLLAGITSYREDGYRSNSTSRATMGHASVGWYLNDTDILTLRLSGGESYIQFPGPLTYDQMQEDPTQSSNLGDQFSEERSGLATLLYETERDWGAARVSSGLTLRDRDSDFSGIYTWNRQFGFSLGPRVRMGSEEDFWMTGVDLNYDRLDVENYLNADRDIIRSWAQMDRLSAAPYLFAQRTVAEKTILNGGARYEYAGTDNLYVEYVLNQLFPPPNPNYKNPPDVDTGASYDGRVDKQGWAAELSAARELSEHLDVFAGYDRVYRYPTLDETASYQGFPLSDPLNENLDPETGNNYEAGTAWSGREWSASLTAFCLMLDNEIVYDDAANLNRNMGSTRRIGADAGAVLTRAWYGGSTRWTFVDARLEEGPNEGNRVPLVPWAYGTTAVWVEPAPELRLTVSYTYVSEQYQGNDEANAFRRMDAYGLLGFRANVSMSEQVSLVFSIDNLTDETYASSAYAGGFYPGAGRGCRMGMKVVF